MTLFKRLWKYRGFIAAKTKQEIKGKYDRSLLGLLWVIINPLIMIVVYSTLFSGVMKDRMSGGTPQTTYIVHLTTGLLLWSLFYEIATKSQTAILENAQLIRNVNFPWFCLPIAVTFSALASFLLSFTIFAFVLSVTSNFPGPSFLSIIPLTLNLIILAIGLGTLTGVINVFFRDAEQLYTMILQFGFWLTPVVCPINVLPNAMQTLVSFNPLASIVIGAQDSIALRQWPQWQSLLYPLLISLALCWLAARLHRNLKADILDQL
jgi:lipopolysaccharide transport system permease protein